MSDSSVIFKRTKSKPSQRARAKSPDVNETETDQNSQTDSPITLASKLKNKAKRAKPKSRLSFGGEDDTEGDGEVFQVKKSNLSQKLKLGPSSANPPISLHQANISNGAPSYSAEHLSELKASTPSLRRPPIQDPYDADMSMDMDSTADFSMVAMNSSDVFLDDQSAPLIPSESSISNAKQKRERLRGAAAEGSEDYISLSLTKQSDQPKGPHPGSRLMREDDELGEGDDEFAEFTSAQERIPLGKEGKKAAASKRKEVMEEMLADAEEQDDETMEWEQEQLRRSGHMHNGNVDEVAMKQVYKPASIPAATALPALGPAIARLTQSLSTLTTSHATSTTGLTTLAKEREQLEEREAELREMVRVSEAKRSWFQAMKGWIESVAEFLDEKFPLLEKLEDEHVWILKERCKMINERRRSDDEDDLSLFLGALPAIAVPESEERDEFGRVISSANPAAARRDRIAARIGRRLVRRAVPVPKKAAEEEGYSTDSSLPASDNTDLSAALTRLSSSAQAILADVRAEDFKDPSVGLSKWFGEWRSKYSDIYTGAWGGLGLVGAWEFWVRLECVGWDPIGDVDARTRQRSLDEFTWYHALYQYSRPRAEGTDEIEEAELGPDGDLVSAMISTAIIPRICTLVEGGAFDPYSEKCVRRMLDLAEEIEASVEADSQKFQALLGAVYKVFAEEVEATHALLLPYLSLNRPPFNPEAIPARQRFLHRRIKLAQNIVRWRKYTQERFGIGGLVSRLLMQDFMPVAESGWEVGGEACARKMVAQIPPELIPPSLKSRLR
ncbi:hypothetical protein HWV62_40096 [Athelia sp. TMB]|nr:hypothetical protein HWV62_40096 [Athelia sp. TMB]